ncbi:MAG: phage major capsid protein [Polyangiaceae bacterium]|nr:phage major capsid protein [Polyangiaceae bacterium]
MGESNQDLIQKADGAVADMVSGGGYLVPEQQKQFFEILIKESKLMQMALTKSMKGDRLEIDKTAFLGQVLVPANEGSAIAEDDRSKPDFQKITLQTKEFIGETRYTYTQLEDNIEGEDFGNRVRSMLGKAVARDVEDLIINGDTSLPPTTKRNRLLRQMDGVLKRAVTRVVAAGGVRLHKGVFETMYRAMPAEFIREGMAFITSKNAAFDYASTVANRQTALGDKTLIEKYQATDFMGYGVVPIPLFPENLGGGTNETNVLMAELKNIVIGIQRNIRIETDRDIRAREWLVVITIRLDMNYQHEPAVVKATGVLAA